MRIRNFNIAFGVLVAVVLALGVQGVADALTLTRVSDKVQSNIESAEFEIQFSVGLKPDTTQIKNDSGKLVNDANPGARIDSSGYFVTEIDGIDYRNTKSDTRDNLPPSPTQPTNSDTDYAVYEKVSSNQYEPYGSGNIFAKSDKNIYSANGYPLYYHIPDADNTKDGNQPKTTSQIKIRTEYFSDPAGKSNRYHYNDEAIAISVSNAAMTVRIKSGSVSYPVNLIDPIPTTRPTSLSDTTASLWEGGGARSLPSSITLICTSSTAGNYTVTITDVSPTNDFPNNAPETLEQAKIEFTLFVEDDAAPTGSLDFSEASGSLLRLETAKPIEPIHTHFELTADALANKSIRYKVTKGSGLLYVGTPTREDRPPVSDLTIHKDAMVYLKMNQTDNEVVAAIAGQDLRTHGKTLVFAYTGTDRRTTTTTSNQQQNQQNQQQQSNTISASPSSISGAPGSTQTLTVSAGTATVGILPSTDFTSAGGSISGSGTTRTLTLPNTAGTYTLQLSALGYTTRNISVVVTAPLAPGTLTIATIGARVGNQQGIRITAQRGGSPPSSDLTVTLSGITLPPTATISAGESSTSFTATLPSATAAAILTANAPGYNPTTFTIPVPSQVATTTTTTTTTPQTGPTGEANSIEIDGSRSIRGTVNQNTPLRVRVVDANNRGVSNVRVTYRVLAPGRGRLSQRGNGRAVVVQTDRNGYASASLTPLGGNVIIEAGAAGVSARVTFIVNVGEAVETREPSTSSRDTSSSREIDPVVHIRAAQRPPMLWIDGGRIYALVGTVVQDFAPSVDNALNIAVGGGKVYWTEQTGESAGTINSAKLDGSDVKELKKIKAVPMGIAVDTAGSQLYWTNSRGRIQSADLDGSGIENVIVDLPGPMDIAVARGLLYWTQYDATKEEGNVGITNTTGRGTPKYITTGSDMPGSLAISGNKVYWTEMTGSNTGTINSASLNGSGATELNDIRAVPMGIAVDTARSKLYWTNSRGRIQSADLDGRKIQSVVDGLGMPGDMVISNSITATAADTPPIPATDASTSKYDVNGDKSIDSKDVDVILLAVSAGITNVKYDVNGDGKVDIKDVMAVNANLDKAPSAPTLLGKQFSALEVSRLQEQIDLLIATGDRSPDAIRILTYLQQMIIMARPEKTQLLANYPNPFNPETWIPYELATDTNVRITIFNSTGVVVRTLQLGQQPPGYYTDRERAAYWDGRNAFGETVASGVYFYQLETNELSLMRKMVILK